MTYNVFSGTLNPTQSVSAVFCGFQTYRETGPLLLTGVTCCHISKPIDYNLLWVAIPTLSQRAPSAFHF